MDIHRPTLPTRSHSNDLRPIPARHHTVVADPTCTDTNKAWPLTVIELSRWDQVIGTRNSRGLVRSVGTEELKKAGRLPRPKTPPNGDPTNHDAWIIFKGCF